jgi:hypothetical protein
MRKADGDTAPSHIFNLCNAMKIENIKALTPVKMLALAYHDARDAVEFCNWYITNREQLELHEKSLINMAYHDGINDATQDPDHTLKNDEYYNDNYIL